MDNLTLRLNIDRYGRLNPNRRWPIMRMLQETGARQVSLLALRIAEPAHVGSRAG